MADKKEWSPDREEALKALIRQTIEASGAESAADLPHRLKRQFAEQAAGRFDVEAYAKEVLKAERRKRGG